MGINSEKWENLEKTMQGQEEMIRRMDGQHRMQLLGTMVEGGARHQVIFAINSWTEDQRLQNVVY